MSGPAAAARYGDGAVAVIGAAGRFPGAADVDTLWRNLVAGVESVRRFERDELIAAGMPAAIADHPELVPAGALLDGIELFDAGFFGYSPGEAELLDPQQRLFLEACWQVLESAGYGAGAVPGDAAVGVYAGATLSSYLFQLAAAGAGGGDLWQAAALGGSPAGAANAPDFFATRVAYKLDLRGPAYTVATACSTGLVAVHLACQALLAFETDLALAGAASVRVPHAGGYIYQESGILSPDGHTRPFDAAARGTVFGHGVGVVALKRLEDALGDGDTILAVVRGTATNNDGSDKVGFTAPSLRAQAAVVEEALAAADVAAETVTLIEAHGTGTALGDPIEVAALTRAFATPRRRYCALGSIKSNLGHLDAAAGISGFIKAVLALHHRTIPPSLNFERPNPKLELAASPFYVPCEAAAWETDGAPRRAGVSSFGFGGTNAHAVLEEAPPLAPPAPSRPYQLLVLSARSPAALEAAAAALAGRLGDARAQQGATVSAGEGSSPPAAPGDLADVAHTLQRGRRPFSWRRIAVVRDAADAAAALADPERCRIAETTADGTPVAFLFPGQGSQYPGMGRELYAVEPTFRRWIDAAADRLREPLEVDLRRLLGFAAAPGPAAGDTLRRTRFAQPALFAIEHALARLWIEWGIRPAALLGHSVGEYTAACLAGVFSFEDALGLVALRGRLMEEMPAGAMLAVDLDERAVTPYLGGGVELTAVNSPGSSVVGGPVEALRTLARRLSEEGVEHRRLHTSHAFHTALMEPALPAFRRAVERIERRAPSVPVVSNLAGDWLTAEQATDPEYWCRQLRRPVRFAAGLETLLGDPTSALLEVGPGETLTALVRRHPRAGRGRTAVPSLAHPKRPAADGERMLAALGRLWQAGAEIDWGGFWRHERRRRTALPTYPFERRRYWVEAGRPAPAGDAAGAASTVGPTTVAAAGGPTVARHQRPELDLAFVPPRGSAEEAVAELFGGALGIARVGRDDDFFALGGDSLIATRVLSRLRDRFGVKLPLDQLFAAPTVAGFAAVLDATAAGTAAGPAAGPPAIRPRAVRGGELAPSSGQARLWFLHQLDPDSPVYNLAGCLRLAGELEAGCLHRALGAVVARHEALRTRLPAIGGRPVQEVDRRLRLALPRVDLGALPAALRGPAAERALESELRRPFDLGRGPLLRALLIRSAGGDHLLQVTVHHAVFDGGSWGVLAREVAALYEAERSGLDSPLPPPPLQYADWAVWQRQLLAAGELDAEIEWWREQLTPLPPPPALPADRPRPAVPDRRGRGLRFRLPAPLTAAVGALSRSLGATPFMTLLAAFFGLLQRSGAGRDLAVGTPVANRGRPELEDLIGFFVDTLVLRSDLGGDPTFAELVERVRGTTLGAFERQEVPFERLVDALQPDRDLSASPLFQVMFALQTPALERLELPGLTLTPRFPDPGTAMFDLSLALMPAGDGLEGVIQYASALFDPTTVGRLAAHYSALLEAAIVDPQQRLGSLALMTAGERHQVIAEWNDPRVEYAAGGLLHTVFEASAERAPDAVAVVGGERHLSYRAVGLAADRLARRLLRMGVGAEAFVGVALSRSPRLVIGLLGVLKAGAAFVPLDPGVPRQRLQRILDDSAARLVVSERSLAGALPVGGRRVVWLDAESGAADAGRRRDRAPSRPEVDPDRLAYAIHTSGSTGRPKGVMIAHRGVVNRLAFAAPAGHLAPGERFLHKASIGFDVALLELFLPLLAAGTVVLARPEGQHDPSYLARLIARERVTQAIFPPTLLAPLLESDEIGDCSALASLASSAEALAPEMVARVAATLPRVRLYNRYGPTEASIAASSWRVEPGSAGRAVPIGRPIARARLYAVDGRLRPVPPGVVGELMIGGPGLARGYLGRPARTAEAFVPDALSASSGGRLYRTGDLVRQRPGGAFEFVGRADHQVKIRGHRVELGEVEAALAAQPQVASSVVTVQEDGPATSRLVAYVVPSAASPGVDPESLRRALAERLPDYMVPAAVVVLDELPLTASGKVDRAALPPPAPGAGGAGAGQRPPLTAAERVLAAIWAEVLGLDGVGVDDDFFALGGDSILSIQIVDRARRAGLPMTARSIFEHPTVATLAAALAAAPSASTVPTARRPATGEAPPTPIQRWFLAADPPAPQHFNQAVALAARRRLAAAPLRAALSVVVAHHDALRLTFARSPGGSWRQRIAPPSGAAPLLAVDLSALPEWAAPGERAAAQLQASLDLARGPLAAGLLLETGAAGGQRLLVTAHHLAVDGVSWRLLLADLEAAYLQLEAGEPPRLPAKTEPWLDWSRRLAADAAAAADREREHWMAVAAETVPPLPVDGDGGRGREGGARRVEVELDAGDTEALITALPERLRVRVDEVLLAALVEAFAAWTGARRLCLDLEGHGREAIEGADVSRTVGWFTALYPVVLEAASEDGPAAGAPEATLAAVKEALRRVPRGGAGFGALRWLAEPEDVELASAPAPEVGFNYLGRLDTALAGSRLFAAADGPLGPLRDPRQARRHAIQIDASVLGGRLRAIWSFNPRAHRRATIERLASSFRSALGRLIDHGRGARYACLTPADFPLAAVTADELAWVRAELPHLADLYPLTPAQEGMLFDTVYSPGSGVYHEQLLCRLDGELDADAFAAAWQGVVDRHPALRTAFFRERLRDPLQAVAEPGAVAVRPRRDDWSGLGADEVEARLGELLAADRRRSFDLSRPPLMRLELIRTGARSHRFLWSVHHLVLDGWSAARVLADVFALYRAHRASRPAALPPVRPFADYVAWLAQRDAAADEAYWRRELGEVRARTPLGIDRPPRRRGEGSASRGTRSLALSAPASAALAAFARRQRLTAGSLVHGAWALLLGRYSGRRDVVFGTAVSGRAADLEGVEQMVGMFMNTLPLRLEVDAGERVTPWLRRVQQRLLALQPHEPTSRARVQALSGVPRGEPLFESLLVIENYPVDAALTELGGELAATEVRFVERAGDPLVVVAAPGPKLELRVGWEPARIDPAAAHRLLGHLAALLTAIPAHPEARLGELSPLSPAERHQLLMEWNDPRVEYPAEGLLHQVLEASAERGADAIAAVAGGRHLSYGELRRRAGRLARRLRQLGVGLESRVGVLLARSPDLLVGLLGVLAAGAAYVPLDPEQPRRRLRLILEDAGVRVAVLERGLAGLLPVSARTRVILDGDRLPAASASPRPGPTPTLAPTPDHLAYVLHTSGSTGRPKGVMIPHRGVVNRLAFAPAAGHLRAGDRFLHKASIGFDVSLLELFLPLAAGGTVVMARPGDQQEPARLAALMARERVQQAIFPPSLLAPLLAAAGIEGCTALHSVASSAEALPAELREDFHRTLPGTTLYNRYGPTEASIAATSHRTDPAAPRAAVPIGRPIARAAIYVLSRELEPVPLGAVGELAIGGPGLARGYLGRPAATAAAFVPSPFARRPGERLYRSGDLARFGPGGVLEFAGRADHQVKIGGFRVELGEVEAALERQPAVGRAVALVRVDGPGPPRLVAYAVPAAGGSAGSALALDPAALRRALAEELPAPMVPAAVVALGELPLNASGKVDRDALPAPERSREQAGTEYVAPRTPTERRLAAIWAEVLGIERAGVDDDFFALGGDSILGLRIAARANQAGLVLTVRQLFEVRTIAGLAALGGRSPEDAPPAAAAAADAGTGAEAEPTIDVDLPPEDLERILEQAAGAGGAHR